MLRNFIRDPYDHAAKTLLHMTRNVFDVCQSPEDNVGDQSAPSLELYVLLDAMETHVMRSRANKNRKLKLISPRTTEVGDMHHLQREQIKPHLRLDLLDCELVVDGRPLVAQQMRLQANDYVGGGVKSMHLCIMNKPDQTSRVPKLTDIYSNICETSKLRGATELVEAFLISEHERALQPAEPLAEIIRLPLPRHVDVSPIA